MIMANLGYTGPTPQMVDDAVFARDLLERCNVAVLPGSYLARESGGINPGKNYVRAALVAPVADCVEAVRRMAGFTTSL